MRKLTYLVASTVDGFIAGPDRADPSGPNGFFVADGAHLTALVSDYPEMIPVHVRQALGIEPENKVFDTVLEGRGSYQIGLDAGIPNAYPHLRHYVFSRTITKSPDPGVDIVATDPVAKVRQLKQEEGLGIWLCGGGTLAAALRPEIDELIVKLHPVVAGAGVPLFAGEFGPQRFALSTSHAYDSGVMHLTYTKV